MLKTSDISERALEDVVAATLAASPMFSARPPEALSARTFLDADELAEFVKTTQPQAWAKLAKYFPDDPRGALEEHVPPLVRKRGTLEVLRNGVAFGGVNLQLAYFRPSSGDNPEHRAKYGANRFSVLRQFHFSGKTPDQSVDLVICLNGLPVASIELKNHFTGQNVQHAVTQYRRRDAKEPFWNRCLVHFAVDDDSVFMATRLKGAETRFLPFNRETRTPIIPGRFASSYLWDSFTDEDGEEYAGILTADTLLLLIQNYLHSETDPKMHAEKMIFPRFHQLMCVRKLLRHAKEHGSGHNYLIQHSAGSGKSNSIAWLAHQLANLCGADGQLVFDSIVVITDRRILDRQLQTTIKQFEKLPGVVRKIDRNTRQLVDALQRGDKIIITTLQKFGFVEGLSELPGKRFAVIVDEAHSSQTGENVKDLKLVLTSEEQLRQAAGEDTEAMGEPEDELDALLEEVQEARQRLPHLSFFAFTATPKNKTLELFGVREDAPVPSFRPFHRYTMRQAIEEGFILDVLESYTTYATYFTLIQNEKADGDREFEKLKTRRLMLEYVDRHEVAIKKKAHIIVDHFTSKTSHKIAGAAKAMVVTHSRAHAVLFKQALDEVLSEQGLTYGVLVAFSGTVELEGTKYTEESMNPPGTGDIAEAFKNPAQRILVCASKFQTGFDQPLLHTMYVDKKLGGVAAVQTLSRLNRTAPGKMDTMVLDFVNTHETIQASFQDYYERTEQEGETDPNKLYNLKYTLEQMRVFTPEDVEEFAELFVIKRVSSQQLQGFFARIVEEGYNRLASEHEGEPEFERLQAEAKDRFRKLTASYVKQYNFISQIMTFTDAHLEKMYLFCRLLLRQFPYEKPTLPLEVIEMIDLDKIRTQEEQNGHILLTPEDGVLDPSPDDGHRNRQAEEREQLKKIIETLNEQYGMELGEGDKVVRAVKAKLVADEALLAAHRAGGLVDLKRVRVNESVNDALLSNADEFLSFMARLETDQAFGKFFYSEMFKWYELWARAGLEKPVSGPSPE